MRGGWRGGRTTLSCPWAPIFTVRRHWRVLSGGICISGDPLSAWRRCWARRDQGAHREVRLLSRLRRADGLAEGAGRSGQRTGWRESTGAQTSGLCARTEGGTRVRRRGVCPGRCVPVGSPARRGHAACSLRSLSCRGVHSQARCGPLGGLRRKGPKGAPKADGGQSAGEGVQQPPSPDTHPRARPAAGPPPAECSEPALPGRPPPETKVPGVSRLPPRCCPVYTPGAWTSRPSPASLCGHRGHFVPPEAGSCCPHQVSARTGAGQSELDSA